MKLIGIAGTNGSGKDSIGELLQEKHGYLFISVTEMLREEARKRGLLVEREALRTISAEWRREFGLGVLVDKAIYKYHELGGDKKFTGLAVASLRNPGENDRVHALEGKVIWVDADTKVRYDRIVSRQRTAEDNKTFEQFLKEEQAEMTHSGDTATLSIVEVKDKCDIMINNNGTEIAELENQLTNALKNL